MPTAEVPDPAVHSGQAGDAGATVVLVGAAGRLGGQDRPSAGPDVVLDGRTEYRGAALPAQPYHDFTKQGG